MSALRRPPGGLEGVALREYPKCRAMGVKVHVGGGQVGGELVEARAEAEARRVEGGRGVRTGEAV